MTIKDQIKDEKLQYDINKESAKISALSSGKIDKYEYLTGEEILPSNQRQIIEQAKFTYSPLGKAFEKQIKTIEDQGIKQVKAIQDKQIINNNDYKNKLLLSNEREIFKDIYNKRLDKIEEFNNKVDYDNLEYVVVNSGKLYDFSELKGLLTFLDEIRKGEISLEEAKNSQQNYLDYLNIIRKGNKNADQKKVLSNINIHFNARNSAIKFIEDYSSMISEAKSWQKNKKEQDLKYYHQIKCLKDYQ